VLPLDRVARYACDLTEYPPTACRLRGLLGDAGFADLQARGGCYGGEDIQDGGVVGYGRTCPQMGCDAGFVWVRPDGALLVAIQHGENVLLHTTDPALAAAPPPALGRFIGSLDSYTEGATFTQTWRTRSAPTPAACTGEEATAREVRFIAAREGLACDAEFSTFSYAAAVVPRGARANFREAPGGPARKAYLVAGDLVRVGATLGDVRCAEYRSLDGRRTVGWLDTADLKEIDHMWDSRTAAPTLAGKAPAPGWVSASRSFGELTVSPDGGGLSLDLERAIAGHMCGVGGRAAPSGPRVYTLAGDCSAVAAVFNNGVYLWAHESCGGARANCTDAYLVGEPR
jgi:hypothetical protein